MTSNLPALQTIGARLPQKWRAAASGLGARSWVTGWLYVLAVAIPFALTGVYYGFFATKRYVSEADFVVRSISSKRTTGLDMLFQTLGVGRAVDDAHSVQSYMLSRDAIKDMEWRFPLQSYFMQDDIDALSRFPRPWQSLSFENFYDYYLDRVSVSQDPQTGISRLKVVAFKPQDAQKIGQELLASAESLVNRMNQRAQMDAIRAAAQEVSKARDTLYQAQRSLTEFRAREMLIDPDRSSVSQLGTITALSLQLNQLLVEISEKEKLSAATPALAVLQARAQSLRERIAQERNQLAGPEVGGLAAKLADYEQLNLLRQLAEKALANATASLEVARQEAQRQQVYLETIVSPSAPDDSTEPKGVWASLTVLVFGAALACVVWLVLAGAKEHMIE